MFQAKVVEKIETHISWSVTFFFWKSFNLWENVEKFCRVGQAADDIMAHAHCMLDNYGCKYTRSGCVILIAFPQQQWSNARASVLRYTYIACLVVFYFLAALNLSLDFFRRSSLYGSRWRWILFFFFEASDDIFYVTYIFRDFCKWAYCASEKVSNMRRNAPCETQQMRRASHFSAMMMQHAADTFPKRAGILHARYTD